MQNCKTGSLGLSLNQGKLNSLRVKSCRKLLLHCRTIYLAWLLKEVIESTGATDWDAVFYHSVGSVEEQSRKGCVFQSAAEEQLFSFYLPIRHSDKDFNNRDSNWNSTRHNCIHNESFCSFLFSKKLLNKEVLQFFFFLFPSI